MSLLYNLVWNAKIHEEQRIEKKFPVENQILPLSITANAYKRRVTSFPLLEIRIGEIGNPEKFLQYLQVRLVSLGLLHQMEVFNEQQFSEFRYRVICFARSIITAYRVQERRRKRLDGKRQRKYQFPGSAIIFTLN